MAVTMDLFRVMARVRDACIDDVKATTIKKRKYMSTIYGDFHKPKSNPNICTNFVGVPVLGWVMLHPLRS